VEGNIDISNQLDELKNAIGNINEENKGKYTVNRYKKNKALKLSTKQKVILEKLAKGRCVVLHLKQRANIILQLAKTTNISSVSDTVHASRPTVTLWKSRWLDNLTELKRIEITES
jgi:hypothetical protein